MCRLCRQFWVSDQDWRTGAYCSLDCPALSNRLEVEWQHICADVLETRPEDLNISSSGLDWRQQRGMSNMRSRCCCTTAAMSNRSCARDGTRLRSNGLDNGISGWHFQSFRQTEFEASIQVQGSNSDIPRRKGHCQGERDGVFRASLTSIFSRGVFGWLKSSLRWIIAFGGGGGLAI